ncbi:MAG: sulfite exporter TauE/SafE family protein [Bacteroidota bacterium]
MTLEQILLILAVGFVAGFLNTIAGGGSLLTLPVLIFLGVPATVANATNRVALFFQNIFGSLGFRSKGISNYPFSLYLGISAFFGAIVGALISVRLDDQLFNRVIAIVIIMVVILTVLNPFKVKDGDKERMDKKHQVISTIVFFFLGIYGGFIQAGVGFLIIGTLTSVNRLNMAKTNSAKVFVVLIYTIAALGVFIYEGAINWGVGLTLAAGNSTGAWIASRWSVKKSDKWIRWFVMVMAIALAIKLWFETN